jgi:hypothetical protein
VTVLVTIADGKTEIRSVSCTAVDVMEEHVASGTPVPTHLWLRVVRGCMEADLSITRLPPESRMVYVIVHMRGGGEMGRQWQRRAEWVFCPA